MKQIFLFNICLLILSNINGQVNSSYEEAVARAGLFHLQKKHKDAILLYEKAFQLQRPNALNAYKAAGVYSLDSNIERAFYYLELALQSGWAEAEAMDTDPYFDYLRKTAPQKWKHIIDTARAVENQFEKRLKLPALRKKINQMAINDQQLRYARIQAKSKDERRNIAREIYIADSCNRAKAKSIIYRYGWPKRSEIGKDGQNNFWLLVQHADDDVLFQQKALNSMQKLRGTNEVDLENYAFLYDRVQCNLNYKQLYGTQVNWTAHGEAVGFRSIIREDLVDKRRKAIGLLPLKIYALSYGFVYNSISALQANGNDSLDLANTHRLIDSANTFYTRNEFQKVYDYYNSASMIMGGMSSVENFEAAILFAQIAAKDNNPQYRSISLDFLNLLYLRREVTKRKLKEQKSFGILHEEARWIEIYDHLK